MGFCISKLYTNLQDFLQNSLLKNKIGKEGSINKKTPAQPGLKEIL
jgi:hypothetical protein